MFGPGDVIAFNAVNAASVYAVDIDGDGDVDVVTASYGSDQVEWFENSGGGDPTWTAHLISSGCDGAVHVHAADVDGDGDVDVLAACELGRAVLWFENSGEPTAPKWSGFVVFSDDKSAPHGVFAVDVDGDGDVDIVTAIEGPDVGYWYENDGASLPKFTARVLGTGLSTAHAVYALDLDGDADVDVLTAAFGAEGIV